MDIQFKISFIPKNFYNPIQIFKTSSLASLLSIQHMQLSLQQTHANLQKIVAFFTSLKSNLSLCNNIIDHQSLMEQVQLNQGQNKNCLSGIWLSASSPTSLSNTRSVSEGNALSDLGDTEKFEMDAQIQPNSVDEVERNQQKKHWNFGEETLLLDLHDQLGNKWTDIANILAGRDHNAVKNYFYAKIRKSLRRLNYFIKSYFNKQLKQLNTNHISKMITLLSQKNPNDELGEIKEQEIKQIKRFLFQMSRTNEQDQLDTSTLKQIQQNVIAISHLLDSVKKNNFIIKKTKLKRKEQQPEAKECLIRQSSTVKKSGKVGSGEQVILNEGKDFIEVQPTIKYQQNSNNLMLMFVPYEYQAQPISVFANYQQCWVNPTSQCIFFSSNIYGNS